MATRMSAHTLASSPAVQHIHPLTVVRSSQRGLISVRCSACTICSSSADNTVTYTIYPRRSRSTAIARVMGSCGEPATTEWVVSQRTAIRTDVFFSQHTNHFLPRPVRRLSSLPPLPIQLLIPIEQNTPRPNKRDESSSPRAVPSYPVLDSVSEAPWRGALARASRRADRPRQPCLLRQAIAHHLRGMVDLSVDRVGDLV